MPQENACGYGALVSEATIFAYVGGNPLSLIDPAGLMGQAPGRGPYPAGHGPGTNTGTTLATGAAIGVTVIGGGAAVAASVEAVGAIGTVARTFELARALNRFFEHDADAPPPLEAPPSMRQSGLEQLLKESARMRDLTRQACTRQNS